MKGRHGRLFAPAPPGLPAWGLTERKPPGIPAAMVEFDHVALVSSGFPPRQTHAGYSAPPAEFVPSLPRRLSYLKTKSSITAEGREEDE